jgi:hypothetical protein
LTYSLSIDRSSLGTTPLVVGDSSPNTYILTRGGLTLPGLRPRVQYADASAYVHGALPLGAVYDLAFITAVIRIDAADAAALGSATTALMQALGQFMFTATTTVDGQTTSWNAHTASIEPQPLRLGETEKHMARYNVTIPVQPLEA